MARILITTFGTAGDLNPFIALGLGLKARGHNVSFAVESDFRSTVIEAGFDTVHHQSGSIEPEFVLSERGLYKSSFPFRSVRAMVARYLLPTLDSKVRDLLAASHSADLIIAPPAHFAASIVSKLLAIPWVSVTLSPVSIPSVHIKPHPWPPPLPAPLQNMANWTQWAVASLALRRIADEPINQIRACYGLPPHHDQLTTGNLSPYLAALAASPAFVPVQPDWPRGLHATGFCFWDTPPHWTESTELDAFFDGAKPVITVSSGSISREVGETFDAFFDVSVAAVRQIGGRALVVGAPPGSLPDLMPEDVLALPFTPFSHVYPRSAAVIHHGGIGTTAQSLRAGVPALVVPWGFDQFYTATQVQRLGTGQWISRRSYTVRRTARALQALLQPGSRYLQRAGVVASQIAGEDGVANLSAAIDGLLGVTEMAGRRAG